MTTTIVRRPSVTLNPDQLFTDSLAVARCQKWLGITPRTVSLEREPAGLPGDKQLSVVLATATVLGTQEAAPVAAALGQDQARLRGLVGQHRAFCMGEQLFLGMHRGARDWELTVDGAEALARTMVMEAAERALASGKLDDRQRGRLERRLERLQALEAEQLAPGLQSRHLTQRLKGEAQGRAEELEQQRRLLLTMAAVREGKEVDVGRLREAAQLYAQLAGSDEDEGDDRRGGQR